MMNGHGQINKEKKKTAASEGMPLMWFVENIDEIYSEIKGKKIEIADELKKHPYGLREFAFVDINGYYIRVAEPD